MQQRRELDNGVPAGGRAGPSARPPPSSHTPAVSSLDFRNAVGCSLVFRK